MDLDFDTLIYIVVTIVFLALGAMGKKKKPVAANPENTGNQVANEDIFEEIISDPLKNLMKTYGIEELQTSTTRQEPVEEILDKYEPDTHIIDTYTPDNQIIDTYENRYDSVQSYLDSLSPEEGVSILDEFIHDEFEDVIRQSEIGDAEEIAKSNPLTQEILEGFNVRKAVIYSEVLKPKYL